MLHIRCRVNRIEIFARDATRVYLSDQSAHKYSDTYLRVFSSLFFLVAVVVTDEAQLQIHHCQLCERFFQLLAILFQLVFLVDVTGAGSVLLRSLKSGNPFNVTLQSRNEWLKKPDGFVGIGTCAHSFRFPLLEKKM